MCSWACSTAPMGAISFAGRPQQPIYAVLADSKHVLSRRQIQSPVFLFIERQPCHQHSFQPPGAWSCGDQPYPFEYRMLLMAVSRWPSATSAAFGSLAIQKIDSILAVVFPCSTELIQDDLLVLTPCALVPWPCFFQAFLSRFAAHKWTSFQSGHLWGNECLCNITDCSLRSDYLWGNSPWNERALIKSTTHH